MLLANLAINVAHLGNMIYLLIHFTKKNKQQETSFRVFRDRNNSVPIFFLCALATLCETKRILGT